MVFSGERAPPEERTRNMRGIDWDAEAVRVANYITRRIVDMHRGALLWHQGIVVAFGTDDYSGDEKSREVVQLLTQIVDIPAWKTEKLAFGINDEEDAGATWVLLLDPALSDDVGGLVDSLDVAIWAAWHLANGRSPESAAIRIADLPKKLRSASSSRQAALPRSRRKPGAPAPVVFCRA